MAKRRDIVNGLCKKCVLLEICQSPAKRKCNDFVSTKKISYEKKISEREEEYKFLRKLNKKRNK